MTTEPRLHDVIRLLVDIPEEGLKRGDIGAIVEVFDYPDRAYEVEFVNEDGSERATRTLTAEQFALANTGPWS